MKMTKNRWLEDEISILKENYNKGMNFICKLLPRHTIGSIKKKSKLLRLNVDKDNLYFDVEIISSIVKESISLAEVFRKLKKSKSGDSYKTLKKFISRNNIDISHFDPWRNNKNNNHQEKPISYWLNEGTNINSSHLKDKLYKYNLKERKCELCGQDEMWNGKKMSLILDHINGISDDNRLENLRIVCPNCNATLPTHCRGSKYRKEIKIEQKEIEIKHKEKIYCKCGNIKNKSSRECSKCSNISQRKVKERPDKEILLKEIKELGYTGTGRKYGVSDNAIRKWIK